ncbi:regulator of G protein signaling domain-containing protein [Diaporthe sp. PMI_573]|nr:regulator of G protein signaling domain-containing protein [Diaporthaceae sp. PMI_573]
MTKDMARSLCQRFLEARFIQSADGKHQQIYTMKGSVWQLTPKGISSLDQFCGIYNAFLERGSPCELNIDHQLRNNLATRMTKVVGQGVAMIATLHEITTLFEDAQNAVFVLMAVDSVPKFLRNPKSSRPWRTTT